MARWAITVVSTVLCCFQKTQSSKLSEINSEACGFANVCSQARIIGGAKISRCVVPWIVRLEVKLSQQNGMRCGGTIITDRVILTAAHCIRNKNYSTRAIHIYIDPTEKTAGLRRQAQQVVVHPDYNDQIYANDIALIKVNKKIEFQEWIMPACLPDSKDMSVTVEYITAGWGLTSEHAKLPKALRAVRLTRMPDGECEKILKQSAQQAIDSATFLCTYHADRGFCAGDSGGPLVGFRSDLRWELVGIVSFNFGCEHAWGPSVFTRVSYFMPWIKRQLMSNSNWRRFHG
ncbi:ovochymase-2-like [Amblyomma americanum]